VSILEIIKMIEQRGITTKIYPLAFPASSPDEAMIVETSQSFTNRGSVYEGTITITVKATHPSRAEQLSKDLNTSLHLLTDLDVGDMQIIMIKSLNPIPAFLGKGKGNEFYYMNNFQVLFS